MPAHSPPLGSVLVHPRAFVIPFLCVLFALLLGSPETNRCVDRWASLCFVLCSLLLFFHRLPDRFHRTHPAGHPEGACWSEVCDVLAAEAIAGY